jgi:hypothetical protein
MLLINNINFNIGLSLIKFTIYIPLGFNINIQIIRKFSL